MSAGWKANRFLHVAVSLVLGVAVVAACPPLRAQENASADNTADNTDGNTDDGIPIGAEDEVYAEDTRPLYQQDPYDLVILKEAGTDPIKVIPLPRPLPQNPKPSDRLTVRLYDERNQEYEVLWEDIKEVKLFEHLVLEEAKKLVSAARQLIGSRNEKDYRQAGKNFDQAFDFFQYLLTYYSDIPYLQTYIDAYLFENAKFAYARYLTTKRENHLRQAYTILDELRQSSPSFNPATVLGALNRIVDTMIARRIAEGNYGNARGLLTRVDKDYGEDKLPVIRTRKAELIARAQEKYNAAIQRGRARDLRGALRLTREMMNIWPRLPGGLALAQKVSDAYPLVVVGVSQPAVDFEPNRIDNWASRRAGRLLHRMLLEFLRPGPEGGEYVFPYGTVELSEDRQQLTIAVAEPTDDDEESITGYEVSQRLLDLATPGDPDYNPTWASLVSNVNVSDVYDVFVGLRRPHVLPGAMLLTRFGDDASTLPKYVAGPYRLAESEGNEVRFTLRPDYPFRRDGQPTEIIERHFEDAQDAISALLRDEIDVIDHLFPADALRLKDRAGITVETYAMPTVHLLVPASEHPFLQNRNFRRALVYGINRENILASEILSGRYVEGCQVITGPFPSDRMPEDPLSYAYNKDIEKRPYRPRLALVLALLAQKEIMAAAKKRGETIEKLIDISTEDEEEEVDDETEEAPEDPSFKFGTEEVADTAAAPADEQPSEPEEERQEEKKKEKPKPKPLIIGHPPHEIPRIACEAIAKQLTAVRIPCELHELPPGKTRDPNREVDLLYTTVAVWEPIVDARRLLGPNGIARSNNPYVNLNLRNLETARNWREVRRLLKDLHQQVANELSVIPLWQTMDQFAYRNDLRGISRQPVSLYQDVEQWTIIRRIKVDE